MPKHSGGYYREGRDKGGDVGFFVITASLDLFSSAGFTTNQITFCVGKITGAVFMRNDKIIIERTALRWFAKTPESALAYHQPGVLTRRYQVAGAAGRRDRAGQMYQRY